MINLGIITFAMRFTSITSPKLCMVHSPNCTRIHMIRFYLHQFDQLTSCFFLHCGQDSLLTRLEVWVVEASPTSILWSSTVLDNPSLFRGDPPRLPVSRPGRRRRPLGSLVLKIPSRHFLQKVWQHGRTFGSLKLSRHTVHFIPVPFKALVAIFVF